MSQQGKAINHLLAAAESLLRKSIGWIVVCLVLLVVLMVHGRGGQLSWGIARICAFVLVILVAILGMRVRLYWRCKTELGKGRNVVTNELEGGVYVIALVLFNVIAIPAAWLALNATLAILGFGGWPNWASGIVSVAIAQGAFAMANDISTAVRRIEEKAGIRQR